MIFAAGIVNDANAFEIVRHPWFMSAFIAGALAQSIKFTAAWIRTRKMDFSSLKTSGGMPSAHSALVSALATAVGLTEGFDKPYAMIAVGFGLIVLCDAATLRREAGRHAKLLNRIVEKLNTDTIGEFVYVEFVGVNLFSSAIINRQTDHDKFFLKLSF